MKRYRVTVILADGTSGRATIALATNGESAIAIAALERAEESGADFDTEYRHAVIAEHVGRDGV